MSSTESMGSTGGASAPGGVVPIALVGCGGMGRRHLTGIAALYRSDFRNVDLMAVCDLNRQNAEDLAEEALQQLGKRPVVFTDLREMARQMPEIQAADVVTDTGTHHRVATDCLEAGFNVQCEKPLAITQRGCDLIISTARRLGKLLTVAENYRRDPINRLARALIQDGAVGTPQLLLETTISGGSQIFITPWRHMKLRGTLAIDAGVHNADVMQYYLGDAVSVYGEGKLFEKYRYKTDTAGPGGFYAKWGASMPDVIEPTGEDALFGYIHFADGVVGQLLFHSGGHGEPTNVRKLFGGKGSITFPGDRNGRPIKLYLDGGKEVSGEEILDYAPSYRLSPVAAQLFGGERAWTYSFPFPETDAKIMALEYHELGECLLTGKAPEVSGEVARRDVALVNAIMESGCLGRPVTIAEVEALAVDTYQREMDVAFGLV